MSEGKQKERDRCSECQKLDLFQHRNISLTYNFTKGDSRTHSLFVFLQKSGSQSWILTTTVKNYLTAPPGLTRRDDARPETCFSTTLCLTIYLTECFYVVFFFLRLTRQLGFIKTLDSLIVLIILNATFFV